MRGGEFQVPSRPAVWLRLALTLCFFAVASPSRLAHADNAPTAAEKKRAKKLVSRANKHKKLGDRFAKKKRTAKAMARYRKAALGYIEAYNLMPHPFFLFKLAEVYRARGDKTWALRGYLTYLEKDPEGLGAKRSTGYVEELKAAIARDEDEGVEETLDDELDPSAIFVEAPKPKDDEPEDEPGDDDDDDDDDDDPDEGGPVERDRTSAPPETPGKRMRWGGIGTAAAGVIALGLGIKFGLDAGSAADTLSANDDAWTAADRALIDSGKSDETKAIVFSVIGVAAIVGGGALYYFGRKKASRKSVSVSFVPSPSGAALSLSGRF